MEGRIDSLNTSVMLTGDFGDKEAVFSSLATDGHFSMNIPAGIPQIYYLYIEDDRYMDSMRFLHVILAEKGGKATVNGTLTYDKAELDISGTRAMENLQEYNRKLKAVNEKYHKAGSSRQTFEEQQRLNMETIEANKDNLLGIYLLRFVVSGLDDRELLSVLDEFPSYMQQAPPAVRMRANAEAHIRTEPGNPYIDIVLPDRDGREIALSSLVGPGKYVFVDFWASWCIPCIIDIQHLARIYPEYSKKGLEIYGVSIGKSRRNWLRAVGEYGMEWVNVADMLEFESRAARDYGVTGIPRNFLIGPDGTILARNIREDEIPVKFAEFIK